MSRTRFESNRTIKYLPRRSTAATRSPCELRRHLGRLVGTHEPRIVDLDLLEPTTREHGCKLRAHALDLG